MYLITSPHMHLQCSKYIHIYVLIIHFNLEWKPTNDTHNVDVEKEAFAYYDYSNVFYYKKVLSIFYLFHLSPTKYSKCWRNVLCAILIGTYFTWSNWRIHLFIHLLKFTLPVTYVCRLPWQQQLLFLLQSYVVITKCWIVVTVGVFWCFI